MASVIKKYPPYDVGDWIILYREPEHEGMHESDADFRPPELWKVVGVLRNPYNEDWVTGYIVAEASNNRSGLGDQDEIQPGKIHRLATSADRQEWSMCQAADSDLEEAAQLIDWLATTLAERIDPTVFPYRAWFWRIGNWEDRYGDA